MIGQTDKQTEITTLYTYIKVLCSGAIIKEYSPKYMKETFFLISSNPLFKKRLTCPIHLDNGVLEVLSTLNDLSFFLTENFNYS